MSLLRALLEPASVAIVGLSADPNKHGRRVYENLRRLGYRGRVVGVHPQAQVPGVEIYRSLADLPAPPEVVVCAAPAAAALEVAIAAGQLEAGGLVVFAGGFAEVGAEGRALQEQLMANCRAGGVLLLGPNSGGVIRPGTGLALSFLTCLDRPAEQIRSGPVGLVTQSGGTGSYLHNLAAERGSGLAIS
ncbi:MAG TPA: CoA-binding protein, partial [Acidimicrobiia bacterium]|nr:CoA-binding protein [Acidimicrobiia bacterium]